jgi:hypothetical protein
MKKTNDNQGFIKLPRAIRSIKTNVVYFLNKEKTAYVANTGQTSYSSTSKSWLNYLVYKAYKDCEISIALWQ